MKINECLGIVTIVNFLVILIYCILGVYDGLTAILLFFAILVPPPIIVKALSRGIK